MLTFPRRGSLVRFYIFLHVDIDLSICVSAARDPASDLYYFSLGHSDIHPSMVDTAEFLDD